MANGSRKSDVIYPNGRQINYNYASGLDSSISRLTSMSDNSGGTVLESYLYLGTGTVVERDHPQDGVNQTYIGTGTGDGGDQYTGLDRFGRVIDQKWVNSSGTAVDEYQYGYDRDGNVLYKLNAVTPANSELYSYDNLNRLTSFERGTLASGDGSIPTPSRTISYTLDALGNQLAVTTNGTEVDQTFNSQNEMVTSGSATLSYDANGNMLIDQTDFGYAYDEWNREFGGEGPQGSHSNGNRGPTYGVTRYEYYTYDAFSRRISDGQTASGFFYDGWQIVQENIPGSGTAVQYQYVWSPVYQNAMIERDQSSGRIYVTQDANWDTTALIGSSGGVYERFVYDPYGANTFSSGYSTGGGIDTIYNWRYLFQGGREDTDGQYYFEHRDEDAALGTWMEQDPAGYVDGMSDNLFEMSSPGCSVDYSGFNVVPPQNPTPLTQLQNIWNGLKNLMMTPDCTLWTGQTGEENRGMTPLRGADADDYISNIRNDINNIVAEFISESTPASSLTTLFPSVNYVKGIQQYLGMYLRNLADSLKKCRNNPDPCPSKNNQPLRPGDQPAAIPNMPTWPIGGQSSMYGGAGGDGGSGGGDEGPGKEPSTPYQPENPPIEEEPGNGNGEETPVEVPIAA